MAKNTEEIEYLSQSNIKRRTLNDLKMEVFSAIAVDSSIENIMRSGNIV